MEKDWIVTIVSVKVKPEHIEAFIEETKENHRNSILEPGNMRFDILQNREHPEMFTFYEAYKSKADVEAHRKTAHYLKWREAVEDFMAEPRTGVPHSVIMPEELF